MKKTSLLTKITYILVVSLLTTFLSSCIKQNKQNERTVYVDIGGKYYHKYNCHYLDGQIYKTPTPVNVACEKGRKPCPICKP